MPAIGCRKKGERPNLEITEDSGEIFCCIIEWFCRKIRRKLGKISTVEQNEESGGETTIECGRTK